MPEDMLARKLQLQDKEAPCLKVLTMDNQYQVAYITGDGKYINSMAKCVTDAVVVLLAVYYVMDLNYPATYGQYLGLLQQHLLDEPYTFFKGSNFILFNSQLNNITE